MTRTEQKRFVRELIAAVQKDVLANIVKMPETWDGQELREYIAEKFRYESTLKDRPDNQRRYRAYRNEVMVRNI